MERQRFYIQRQSINNKKTLLLSQVGFLADVVNIPNNVVKQIDTLIWSFLLDSKQPLVNRNTMFLDTSLEV